MFTGWRKKPRNREMGDLEVGKRGLERAQMFGKSRQLLSGTEAKEQGWVGQQIKV